MWKRTEDEQTLTAPSQGKVQSLGKPAVIGRSLTVTGEIAGEEDLLVEGRIEGTVSLKKHCVTIGETGAVDGDIHARIIRVSGDLKGDLFGGEQVVVHSTGNVRGNITAPQVCLENGAKLKGSIDMDPQPGAQQIESALKKANEAEKSVERLSKGQAGSSTSSSAPTGVGNAAQRTS